MSAVLSSSIARVQSITAFLSFGGTIVAQGAREVDKMREPADRC
jgi:hypothetical protein